MGVGKKSGFSWKSGEVGHSDYCGAQPKGLFTFLKNRGASPERKGCTKKRHHLKHDRGRKGGGENRGKGFFHKERRGGGGSSAAQQKRELVRPKVNARRLQDC